MFVLARLGLSEAQLREGEDLARRIIGVEFPWMGISAATWDNAVDRFIRDWGDDFELRRHNKENVRFQAMSFATWDQLIYGTRWSATDGKRIDCVA